MQTEPEVQELKHIIQRAFASRSLPARKDDIEISERFVDEAAYALRHLAPDVAPCVLRKLMDYALDHRSGDLDSGAETVVQALLPPAVEAYSSLGREEARAVRFWLMYVHSWEELNPFDGWLDRAVVYWSQRAELPIPDEAELRRWAASELPPPGPLPDAIDARDSGEVHRLLRCSHGAGGAMDLGPALEKASWMGDESIVRLLLESGADPNASDRRGRTPLHAAAHNPSPCVVALLLEHGADPNIQDLDTFTPLALAAQWGNADSVVILLRHGAHLSETDDYGGTALHAASVSGRLECVDALIGAGADPNAQALRGETPLMMAATRGQNIAVVRRLLEAGANISARDNRGRTALFYAVRSNTPEG